MFSGALALSRRSPPKRGGERAPICARSGAGQRRRWIDGSGECFAILKGEENRTRRKPFEEAYLCERGGRRDGTLRLSDDTEQCTILYGRADSATMLLRSSLSCIDSEQVQSQATKELLFSTRVQYRNKIPRNRTSPAQLSTDTVHIIRATVGRGATQRTG